MKQEDCCEFRLSLDYMLSVDQSGLHGKVLSQEIQKNKNWNLYGGWEKLPSKSEAQYQSVIRIYTFPENIVSANSTSVCPINCVGYYFQLCRYTSQQKRHKPCFCGTYRINKPKSLQLWEEYVVYGLSLTWPYAGKVVYPGNVVYPGKQYIPGAGESVALLRGEGS